MTDTTAQATVPAAPEAKPAAPRPKKAPAKTAARARKPVAPAAKPEPAPRPARKAPAAPAGAADSTTAAAKAAKATKSVKVVKTAKPAKPAKPEKAPKLRARLVRDSFTMPESEFALIATLKARALDARRHAKKSELLRAGLRALAALDAAALLQALDALEPVPTGRPKKGHGAPR